MRADFQKMGRTGDLPGHAWNVMQNDLPPDRSVEERLGTIQRMNSVFPEIWCKFHDAMIGPLVQGHTIGP